MLNFDNCIYRSEDEQFYISFKVDSCDRLINNLTCIDDFLKLCSKYNKIYF